MLKRFLSIIIIYFVETGGKEGCLKTSCMIIYDNYDSA